MSWLHMNSYNLLVLADMDIPLFSGLFSMSTLEKMVFKFALVFVFIIKLIHCDNSKNLIIYN